MKEMEKTMDSAMENKSNEEKIHLSIPNKPEYVSVVRLTLVAIANRIGFNIEEIEDMKVAVAEACTNAIIHGKNRENASIDIAFLVKDQGLIITVEDQGKGCEFSKIREPSVEETKVEELKEHGLGIFIIKSLMDEVKIKSQPNQGMTITMTKLIG